MRIEIERLWCNDGNHDKIYGLYYNTETRELLSIWGRRGKNLSQQVKKNKSMADFDAVKYSKIKKGYERISVGVVEADIALALDEVANSIDGFKGILKNTVEEIEADIKNPFATLPIDSEVECVSDGGVGEFEVGVAYLFKGVDGASDMLICVEDMEGNIQTVMSDRFAIPEKVC